MRNKKRIWLLLMALLFVGACRNDLLTEDDLAAARNAYTERNLPLTERLLERFLRDEQNSEKRWEAWQLLLQALNADRIHERASLECLDAMLVEYEGDPRKLAEILPLIGRYNKDIRHFAEAGEAWNSYLELPDLDDSQRVYAYRQLAAMQFQQRHYVAAEETLEQCMSLPMPEQDKLVCMLDLAEGYMLRDQMQEVADLAQQILESKPEGANYGKACYLLADALEQLGKSQEALHWFEKALKFYPNPLVIENRIGNLRKQ